LCRSHDDSKLNQRVALDPPTFFPPNCRLTLTAFPVLLFPQTSSKGTSSGNSPDIENFFSFCHREIDADTLNLNVTLKSHALKSH
jgi:hypothetical protein